MHKISFKINALAVVAAVSTMLSACGGGGGGGGGTTATAPVATAPVATAPVVAASTLVTSVPSATYTGELAAAFNLINAERGACGFGLLTQNAALDAAATSHANYLFQNRVVSHAEVPGLPGFTGATSLARAKAKGYAAASSSEVVASTSGNSVKAVRGLLVAPYHQTILMRGNRDVGFGRVTASNGQTILIAVQGSQSSAGMQLLAGDAVQTYPCNGSVGVNRQLQYETPSPVPGRDLVGNPIGTPILVSVRTGNVLAISSSSMIKVATGASVKMRPAIGVTNDPNRTATVNHFMANEAYVAPDTALDPNSEYQVTVNGTNNGVAFRAITFKFTTGAN